MKMNDQMSTVLIVNNENKIRIEAIVRVNICINISCLMCHSNSIFTSLVKPTS